MARKGKNKTGTRKNNTYKENKKSGKIDITIPIHPAASKIEAAYKKTFWSPGYEWRGLQSEKPNINHAVYYEVWYYLDELEDEKLYEKMFRKMLKELKINGEIEWYELSREFTSWSDEEEFLRLRVK